MTKPSSFIHSLTICDNSVGICSFRRFLPQPKNIEEEEDDNSDGEVNEMYNESPAEYKKLLFETCLIVSHELCLQFSIQYCSYYKCLMNFHS